MKMDVKDTEIIAMEKMMYFIIVAEQTLVGMNIGYYGNVKCQSS